MPKERNKADSYREKAYEGDTKAMNRMLAPMASCAPSVLRRASPESAASPINGDAQRYELAANGGDAQAQFATGWFLMTGTGVPVDEKKGLKWIHKATFQGYQPAIDYCKEHNIKWY